MRAQLEVGYRASVFGKRETFGVVWEIAPRQLSVYVDDRGAFTISIEAVVTVALGAVTFDGNKLGEKLCRAIGHERGVQTTVPVLALLEMRSHSHR
jgi:hypothetical protein